MTAGAGPGPVVLVDERADPGDVDADRVVRLSRFVLDVAGVGDRLEVGVTLVDVDAIAALAAEHLDGGGSPTDVLAFPIDDTADEGVPGLLGDVVICPAVAAAQAAAHRGVRPGHDGSVQRELDLLVVHGLLHLLGHDHATDEERVEMQTREADLLTGFWGVP